MLGSVHVVSFCSCSKEECGASDLDLKLVHDLWLFTNTSGGVKKYKSKIHTGALADVVDVTCVRSMTNSS